MILDDDEVEQIEDALRLALDEFPKIKGDLDRRKLRMSLVRAVLRIEDRREELGSPRRRANERCWA